MKYPNGLGKDFNTKPKDYKHLTNLRDQMIERGQLGESHIFTEETPIKKSQMDQLYRDYFVATPEYIKRKIGPGIKNWFLDRDSHGTISLFIKQKDRPQDPNLSDFLKSVSISHWGQCVSVSAKWVFTCFGTGVLADENKMYKVKEAARKAVEDQKKEFRSSVKDECQKCGKKAYGLELQVDHVINFMDIFNNFIKKYGYEDNFLIENINKDLYVTWWYFTNEELKEKWRKYHKENATLQLLCVPCHKDKTYKK